MIGKKFREKGQTDNTCVFLAVSRPGDTRGKGGVHECRHAEVEGLTVIVYEGDVHMASQVDGELAIYKRDGEDVTWARPLQLFMEKFEEVNEPPVEVATKTPDQLRAERFAKGGQDAGTHEADRGEGDDADARRD